jgi:hypothetical protein
MTNKIMEQIAETAVYDYGDETEIENKYEKYRDDQRNTGIIAALVGGFALSNSWNMNIYGHTDTENLTNVELGSYTLAVLAVHGCTCSALASAFLYKSITSAKSPKAGVAWVERHPVLVQLPWYKVRLVYVRISKMLLYKHFNVISLTFSISISVILYLLLTLPLHNAT